MNGYISVGFLGVFPSNTSVVTPRALTINCLDLFNIGIENL